jgi:hypothetical protein
MLQQNKFSGWLWFDTRMHWSIRDKVVFKIEFRSESKFDCFFFFKLFVFSVLKLLLLKIIFKK